MQACLKYSSVLASQQFFSFKRSQPFVFAFDHQKPQHETRENIHSGFSPDGSL